jgi:hypothetical protein
MDVIFPAFATFHVVSHGSPALSPQLDVGCSMLVVGCFAFFKSAIGQLQRFHAPGDLEVTTSLTSPFVIR